MLSYMKILTCMIGISITVTGCSFDQYKKMEKENADLQASLRHSKEMLEQSQAREKKQNALVTASQEKIAALEKRVAEMEMLKTELRKQKEFAESELVRQKAEAQKQTALANTYQAQIKKLTAQLAEAREMIKKLQAESEKHPLSTQPVQK